MLTNPLENGRSAWKHDIDVQILADVITPRVDETWLEQYFLETVVEPDDGTLAKLSTKFKISFNTSAQQAAPVPATLPATTLLTETDTSEMVVTDLILVGLEPK